MDKVRQGEIALELVKYFLKTNGSKVFSSLDLGKELLKAANATSVSAEELKKFLRPLMVDTAKSIVDQGFATQPEGDHHGHDGHGSQDRHDGHGSQDGRNGRRGHHDPAKRGH